MSPMIYSPLPCCFCRGPLLRLAVRVRPAEGHYLRSVSLKVVVLGEGAVPLNSAPPAIWEATLGGFPVTAATDVPGEPSTLLVLSGASVPSGISHRGEVELGVLSVVAPVGTAASLALLSVEILSLESVADETCDILARPHPSCYAALTFTRAVAATGYVRLLPSRRSLLGLGNDSGGDGGGDGSGGGGENGGGGGGGLWGASVGTTGGREGAAPESAHSAALRLSPPKRRLGGCDPCGVVSHRVPGDFNGDCHLLSSDASAVQVRILTDY